MRRAAEQEAREEVAKARDLAVKEGAVVPENADPLEVLSDLLTEAVQVKDYLGSLARRLQDDQLRYEGRAGEQLRAEWQAYQSMMRDCQKLAESMLRLGLDERRVRVQEGQARMMVHVLTRTLERLGLEGDMAELARQYVGEELRALDSREPPEPVVLVQSRPRAR